MQARRFLLTRAGFAPTDGVSVQSVLNRIVTGWSPTPTEMSLNRDIDQVLAFEFD